MSRPDPAFWRGRRVLVTGHTGFKGAWLCAWLERMGAEVSGFALPPDPSGSLFAELSPWTGLSDMPGDIRKPEELAAVCRRADPEIVIHMAAQSLVRRGYRAPAETFATNVEGTGNLLEALERRQGLRAVLVVTSDKCYRNDGTGTPFREDDTLGGDDPYSASKATQEIVAQGWSRGLYQTRDGAPRLATARAGNVIGGGDRSEDRIVPDLFRALAAGRPLVLRNPTATRPWQHVLDVLAGYLAYCEALVGAGDASLPRALNFGPRRDAGGDRTVAWLAETTLGMLRETGIDAPGWVQDGEPGPREAASLSLDAGLARTVLGWEALLGQDEAVRWTAEWHGATLSGTSAREAVSRQIDRYEELAA